MTAIMALIAGWCKLTLDFVFPLIFFFYNDFNYEHIEIIIKEQK